MDFFVFCRLQEKLLPQILLSEIQMMLDKGVDSKRQQFLQQVDRWLRDRDKSDYLSSHYCEELAAIFLIQDKVDQAQHQVERSLTMFLNSWTELNPSSHNLRTKQLLDLQKTAELQVCAFTGLNTFFPSFWKKIMESIICVILLSFEECASNRYSGKEYYLNFLLEVDISSEYK
jgi:hypothetical protein